MSLWEHLPEEQPHNTYPGSLTSNPEEIQMPWTLTSLWQKKKQI